MGARFCHQKVPKPRVLVAKTRGAAILFLALRQYLWVKVGRNWVASLSITPQGFAVVRGVMESFLPWLR